jgi:hypothetical protein
VAITGANVSITNLGTMFQSGGGKLIQDNAGVLNVQVTNGSATNSTALMKTANGDVFQMNKANGSVTLNNYGTMQSLNPAGAGSQAVDFAALQGANSITNFATGVMKASEADAVRPGLNGVVLNQGLIFSSTTTGSSSDGVDMQSNSGLNLTNDGTGTIQGARHGITGGAATNLVSFTASITNNLGGVIQGDNGSGINLDGFNALQQVTVLNNGRITGNGLTGDGDGIDVDGIANVTNTGIIRSINAFSAVAGTPAQSEGITIGGGTVINSGTIEGLVAAGNTNAVGRGISFLGNDITTGPLTGTREAIYGNAVVTNNAGGLIRGDSDSGIAVDGPASNLYTVSITNNAGATIRGGGLVNAAIRTGFDNDTIVNSGTIDGGTSGQALSLGGGNDNVTIAGGAASVIGNMDGGTGTNIIGFDPGAGGTFSYSGIISNFTRIDVLSGLVILDGVNRVASASDLSLKGGTLETANGGGADGETFGCLNLSANSGIDLASSTSLTFNCLGTVGGGTTLTVLDYVSAISPDHTFRFLTDLTSNATFLALIANTTINGHTAVYQFDGTFTNVTPSPEPGTFVLLGLSALGVAAVRRRRA